MPGYVLIEQKSLTPPMPEGKGIKAKPRKMAFLDFLRELEQEEFPFNENSQLQIVGLEEVLIASRPDIEKTARMIRQKLQSGAVHLDSRSCPDIQIIFRQPLESGEYLTVDHVTAKRLPVYLIFGTPPVSEINGQKCYNASFNLSGN